MRKLAGSARVQSVLAKCCLLQTWEYENSWLHCVDFLGEDIHPYDKRYRFRVRWSIPTRRKPVPRATASVYFTFVVSTIKPKVSTNVQGQCWCPESVQVFRVGADVQSHCMCLDVSAGAQDEGKIRVDVQGSGRVRMSLQLSMVRLNV